MTYVNYDPRAAQKPKPVDPRKILVRTPTLWERFIDWLFEYV